MKQNTTITIRLRSEFAKRLKRIARDEMCGTSEAVRLLLERAVTAYANDPARLPRIAAKAKAKARQRSELVGRLKREGRVEVAAQIERAEVRRLKRFDSAFSWDR